MHRHFSFMLFRSQCWPFGQSLSLPHCGLPDIRGKQVPQSSFLYAFRQYSESRQAASERHRLDDAGTTPLTVTASRLAAKRVPIMSPPEFIRCCAWYFVPARQSLSGFVLESSHTWHLTVAQFGPFPGVKISSTACGMTETTSFETGANCFSDKFLRGPRSKAPISRWKSTMKFTRCNHVLFR